MTRICNKLRPFFFMFLDAQYRRTAQPACRASYRIYADLPRPSRTIGLQRCAARVPRPQHLQHKARHDTMDAQHHRSFYNIFAANASFSIKIYRNFPAKNWICFQFSLPVPETAGQNSRTGKQAPRPRISAGYRQANGSGNTLLPAQPPRWLQS